MRVAVTLDHIVAGKTKNHFYNPVALAVASATCATAVVTHEFAHTEKFVARLPREIVQWLRDYNSGNPVSPTEFWI